MKKLLILTATLALTGCTSIEKVLRVTQSVEGTGYVTTVKPYVTITATVENARQEDGKYKADRLDVNVTTPLGKTIFHFDDYSRPLINSE